MSPRRRAPQIGVYDPSEAAFQAHVLQLAAVCGWMAYHTHDSRRSQRGFPDLVLVRPGVPGPQLVFAELKSRTGQLRAEQRAWIAALQGVALHVPDGRLQVHLWRPPDMDERIPAVLGAAPDPEPPPAA